MNTSPTLTPQSETLSPVGLFPANALRLENPGAKASPDDGARKRSRWEEYETTWFVEEVDFTHSGINE